MIGNEDRPVIYKLFTCKFIKSFNCQNWSKLNVVVACTIAPDMIGNKDRPAIGFFSKAL